MADNTDEDHLYSSTNIQSKNPPDEISSTNDTVTINPNQESENMEVHHHPDIQHRPKKWKEYILESLMIFLAVTMGFIAENVREHQTEKKIGMELIHSLVDDLKADTAAFNDNAMFWTNRLKGIDSLRYYVQPDIKSNNKDRMHYWVEQMFEFKGFIYHDATMQQLRNTGNFRLIDKRNIIDSLIAYDGSIKSLYFNVEITTRNQYLHLRHMQTKLFNSSYYKRFSSKLPETIKTEKNFLIQDKPNSKFEYYNELYNYKHLGSIQILNDKNLHGQATRLIELIQKEYALQ